MNRHPYVELKIPKLVLKISPKVKMPPLSISFRVGIPCPSRKGNPGFHCSNNVTLWNHFANLLIFYRRSKFQSVIVVAFLFWLEMLRFVTTLFKTLGNTASPCLKDNLVSPAWLITCRRRWNRIYMLFL